MTWVQFGPDEPPAPSLELQTLSGTKLQIADFRGRSNLALLFLHGWNCSVCRRVIQEFSNHHGDLDAELLLIVPDRDQAPPESLPGLQVLIDDGRSHAEFAALLEFDLPGKLMLFVLNVSNSPVRAWVGAEADELDLVQKTREALDYIVIQCPE